MYEATLKVATLHSFYIYNLSLSDYTNFHVMCSTITQFCTLHPECAFNVSLINKNL